MAAAYTSGNCVTSASNFAACLSNVVINPILAILFAVGLLVFVYGIVEFLWGLSNDTNHREEGKKHMIWGLVGMFVMVAAYTLITIIARALNVPIPH